MAVDARRRRARVALGLYGVAGLLVVLAPDRTWLLVVLRALHDLALDAGLGWQVASRVEVACNVLLVVPIPVLGALAIDRWGFVLWVGGGLAASSFVELAQLAWLPGRTASLTDVGANTLGALLGWVIAIRLVRHRAVGPP